MTNVADLSLETASLAAKHPLLFHYTREHAFKSIVGGNSLWATYFEDLNDSTEFRHMREPLVEAMSERLFDVFEDFERSSAHGRAAVRKAGGARQSCSAFSQRFMKNLYDVTFKKAPKDRLHNVFVASFCSHKGDPYIQQNGLLSQWRGYAADGGFCLVFDTKKLEELIKEEQRAYQYLFIDLVEAHYFKGQQNMPDSFTMLVDKAKTVVEQTMSGIDPAVDDLFVPFVTSATAIKHRGFEEECEVRIVAMALSTTGDEKMKGVSGYISMPLKNIFPCDLNAKVKHHIRLFGSGRTKLPIVKMIVGPARDQRRNEEIARRTVGTAVEVVCSDTPLIV